MLRAMDELEKSVNDLLGRLQKRSGSARGAEGRPHQAGARQTDEEQVESKQREAAELIRRAIKRLKSL